ncbi:TetR family transcriptional regulator [Acinetobacter larvae]|uniref:TetR family transcriptional regulator n=1 Tax=Acinetobacter larvae TaxID=1789224 RepID=A0A1B2LVM6_9GAMM|nr:TetR family transcriptional regulator [Acinetobacter larvae]AOA56977.1 TetR family transcriptional regulator [Acinetobacter larvae]
MSIRDERKLQSRQALLNAALSLSRAGRAFSSISLRELTREVGLVPTAFYRHFNDMSQLGTELVDQVSVDIKTVLYQIGRNYLVPDRNHSSLDIFITAVEQNPAPWIFMISERWGGSEQLRLAISREINFLVEDLSQEFAKIDAIQQLQNLNHLNALTGILINLSFTWAMSWIDLLQQPPASEQNAEKERLKQHITQQAHLMFCGAVHTAKSTAQGHPFDQ